MDDAKTTIAWLHNHHTSMRRYISMLDSSNSAATREGLLRWVRRLRSNASNCVTQMRRLRED